MQGESSGLIIGLSIGVVIGVALAIIAFFCYKYHRNRSQVGNNSSRRTATIPIRTNGADSCNTLSDSSLGTESPRSTIQSGVPFWLRGLKKANVISASGILEYSYKDLQKATYNFTTLIGQGAFGPVYKAQMPAGETVAVKVLANDSKQGEKEFQTEVMLLGRLHHRNLVNLIGYCAEKNQHMLIYVYMSRGSLDSHLYGLNKELDEVRGRILGRTPLPNTREVFAEVRREESRRQVMLGQIASPTILEISALMTNKSEANTYRTSKRQDRSTCEYCHKIGHTKARCWKLHGKPVDFKPMHPSARDPSPRDPKGYQASSEKSKEMSHPLEHPFFNKENLDQVYKMWNSHQSTNPSTEPSSSFAQKGTLLGEDDWQC